MQGTEFTRNKELGTIYSKLICLLTWFLGDFGASFKTKTLNHRTLQLPTQSANPLEELLQQQQKTAFGHRARCISRANGSQSLNPHLLLAHSLARSLAKITFLAGEDFKTS